MDGDLRLPRCRKWNRHCLGDLRLVVKAAEQNTETAASFRGRFFFRAATPLPTRHDRLSAVERVTNTQAGTGSTTGLATTSMIALPEKSLPNQTLRRSFDGLEMLIASTCATREQPEPPIFGQISRADSPAHRRRSSKGDRGRRLRRIEGVSRPPLSREASRHPQRQARAIVSARGRKPRSGSRSP